jgi:uncharacterized Fe-S center protein
MNEPKAGGGIVNLGGDGISALDHALVEVRTDELQNCAAGCRVNDADGAVMLQVQRTGRVAEGGR